MREYIVRPRANDDYWRQVDDGTACLARTVYEDHELIDIGVMDKDGNPIMARKRLDPVGFVRWRNA